VGTVTAATRANDVDVEATLAQEISQRLTLAVAGWQTTAVQSDKTVEGLAP
jgi:hypothetical protein